MEVDEGIEWALQELTFKQQSTENVNAVVNEVNRADNPHKTQRYTKRQVESYLVNCRNRRVVGREAY